MSVSGETPVNRKVHRDLRFDSTSTQVGLQVPIVDTSATPSSTNVNARNVLPKGKIATDRSDCCLYLSDGKQWNLVGGCAGTNSARVHLSANQPGLTPFVTNVLYDVVDSDPSGMYDATTGIFTIPQDGVYHIKATMCLTNPSFLPLDFIGSILVVNGGNIGVKSVIPLNAAQTPANIELTTVVDVELALTAGQTLELRASVSGGATVTARGDSIPDGGPSVTWFQIRRVE